MLLDASSARCISITFSAIVNYGGNPSPPVDRLMQNRAIDFYASKLNLWPLF